MSGVRVDHMRNEAESDKGVGDRCDSVIGLEGKTDESGEEQEDRYEKKIPEMGTRILPGQVY